MLVQMSKLVPGYPLTDDAAEEWAWLSENAGREAEDYRGTIVRTERMDLETAPPRLRSVLQRVLDIAAAKPSPNGYGEPAYHCQCVLRRPLPPYPEPEVDL